MYDYGPADIIESLERCGVKGGDTLFIHSNLGFFGRPEGASSIEEVSQFFFESIVKVIGLSGTIVVPSFTYSFTSSNNSGEFDPKNSTPKDMGSFVDYVFRQKGAARSHDPMFSVVAYGKNAEQLTKNVSDECFGEDSFWGRFYKADGKICNFNFNSGSTFIHYVEKKLQVPYRSDIIFEGSIVLGEKKQSKSVTFFCRKLDDPSARPDFRKFDELARQSITKTAKLGRGEIVCLSAADTYELVSRELKKFPRLLVKG